MIAALVRAGWAWYRAEDDYHLREGAFEMGFEECIEVGKAEPGWKGIPGRKKQLSQSTEAESAAH